MEEVEFLRDQIYRLNSVLAQYHSKYPPLSHRESSVDGGLFPAGAKAPKWLTDKSLLSPLLAEYESHIQTLTRQGEAYQEELKLSNRHVENLLDENKKLTRDLKEQVQLQLDALNNKSRLEDGEVGAVSTSSNFKYQEVVDNLQDQLSVALQEKENANQLLQDSLNELDQLKSLLEKEFSHIYKSIEGQCSLKIEQYGRNIAELNTELNKHNLLLNDKEQQLKIFEENNSTLIKEVDRLKVKLDQRNNELEMNGHGNADLQSLVEAQDQIIETLNQKHKQTYQDYHKMASERKNLVQQSKVMSDQITQLKHQHAQSLEQLKLNVQLIENSLLEKDQALIRANQLEEETNMLKSSLEDLVQEAGLQTKRAAEEVQSECLGKVNKMCDLVAELEDQLRSKSNEIERLKRSEGQKGSEPGFQYQDLEDQIQSLRDRLNRVELKRDQLLVELNEAKAEKKTLINGHEMLAQAWKEKEEKLNQYVESLIREADDASAQAVEINREKVKLSEEVSDLKAEQATFENKMMMRDSVHAEALVAKEEDARNRLRVLDETHQRTTTELRIALTKQQQLEAGMRQENVETRKDFESALHSVKEDRDCAKREAANVAIELRQERSLREELVKRLEQTEKKVAGLEEKLRAAEEDKARLNAALIEKMEAEKRQLTRVRKLEHEIERLNVTRVTRRSFDSISSAEDKGLDRGGIEKVLKRIFENGDSRKEGRAKRSVEDGQLKTEGRFKMKN